MALCAFVLTVALTPLAADATITPDNGFGTGGTASVPVECAETTSVHGTTPLGSQAAGRFYMVEQCAAGWFRVIALASDGTIDDSWGTHGRLTLKFPTNCAGKVELHPAAPLSDGSVYMATSRTLANGDLHVCLARITRSGKAWWNFGGSTPIRRLDRTGGSNTFAGFAVEPDYLYVFTSRQGGNGTSSAAFVNRYTEAGKPDTKFSGDGQRAFVQPYQTGAVWGGVYIRRSTIAIGVDNGRGLAGIQFVRFEYDGDLNKDFGGDGTVFVSNASLENARTGVPGQMAMDASGRIVFVAVHDGPGDGNHWLDLVRLRRSGVQDSAFNAATQKISTLQGNHFTKAQLQTTLGHYAVGWNAGIGDRTTGYGGAGERWLALGPNGTAQVPGDLWRPDETVFYDFEGHGTPLSSVDVTKSKVQ